MLTHRLGWELRGQGGCLGVPSAFQRTDTGGDDARAEERLLGSWYALAVASGEKGFALEKASKNIEGVMVTLTPENNLKLLSSRHRLERRDVNVVEVPRQSSGWVFENPSLGVLDYRGLGTNFRDYAIVFTQLEFKDEAFNTVELYSKPEELASQEALRLFARWSKDLGFLSQQQATR
ncbi:PREDICTED: epididymal-specific lipocalin-6-like [Odobenus rosmarus divergens]|uniref:Epididymal-specific lipocalin-6-like n=1 Tax=Odobenus rosmarus divergens TaxID=9708 RepID=A0A9B0HC27_ODORO